MKTRWLFWGFLSLFGCAEGPPTQWYLECARSQKVSYGDLAACTAKASDPCGKSGARCFDGSWTMVCADKEPETLCTD
jgi:hypothetical protein